jgi:hypothetical protein
VVALAVVAVLPFTPGEIDGRQAACAILDVPLEDAGQGVDEAVDIRRGDVEMR